MKEIAMKIGIVLIALGIVSGVFIGCTDSPSNICKQHCWPEGIKTFNDAAGQCQCNPVDDRHAAESDAELFCDGCAKRCAPAHTHLCKFGNNTWGAGPDVCECEIK